MIDQRYISKKERLSRMVCITSRSPSILRSDVWPVNMFTATLGSQALIDKREQLLLEIASQISLEFHLSQIASMR